MEEVGERWPINTFLRRVFSTGLGYYFLPWLVVINEPLAGDVAQVVAHWAPGSSPSTAEIGHVGSGL